MIRQATAEDLGTLVEMGLRFIASTSYRGRLAANPGQIAHLMQGLIWADDGTLLVAEDDGKIAGMIGVCIYVHPISGERIAGELFWWMQPEQRGDGVKLLKAAEAWADEKCAVRMQMIAPDEKVAKAYQALGYGRLEEVWQRDL